jgi:hypothetical protein
MKRSILLAVMALVLGIGSLASAQTTTTAPAGTHPHPRIAEVRARAKEQMLRIHEGVKSGKLTKEQAESLIANLKAVKAQIEADFTTNGKKELTDEQLAQLNQMLDANSKVIYTEKNPGGAAPPATGGTAPTTSTAP